MKKLLLIAFISFLLCGCTANYNLTINNGKIVESFSVLGINEINTLEHIESNLVTPTPSKKSDSFDKYTNEKVEGVDYYDVTRIEEGNLIGLNYKYEFTFDSYYDSNVMNTCYDYFKVINEDNNITISTSTSNKCMNSNVDVLSININTNYKVVDSNADKVEGHNYTWTINKHNNNNKNIYIKLNTLYKAEKTDEEKKQEEKVMTIFLTIGITLAILSIIVIISLMYKKRMLENN